MQGPRDDVASQATANYQCKSKETDHNATVDFPTTASAPVELPENFTEDGFGKDAFCKDALDNRVGANSGADSGTDSSDADSSGANAGAASGAESNDLLEL